MSSLLSIILIRGAGPSKWVAPLSGAEEGSSSPGRIGHTLQYWLFVISCLLLTTCTVRILLLSFEVLVKWSVDQITKIEN